MAMNSEELQPVGWLSEVVLEGFDQPVRVVLDGREGNRVFVRQADPEDGDDPPRVPLYPGEELIVMQALIHVSHHITPDVGRTDDLLFFDADCPRQAGTRSRLRQIAAAKRA
jgi:hypothetical protein